MKAKTNLTMLCDFYELTMGNGYFQTGLADRICYFCLLYTSRLPGSVQMVVVQITKNSLLWS